MGIRSGFCAQWTFSTRDFCRFECDLSRMEANDFSVEIDLCLYGKWYDRSTYGRFQQYDVDIQTDHSNLKLYFVYNVDKIHCERARY